MVQGLDESQAPTSDQIRIEPLGQHHDRAAFVCSKEHLTKYFNGTNSPRPTIDRDIKNGLVRPFVMIDERNEAVIGYFTLSNQSIPKESLPSRIANKLGYSQIPTMLLGRMAISVQFEGNGLGTGLLLAALYKTYSLTDGGKGCYAVVLDAGDDDLVKWYSKRGFISVPTADRPKLMVISMAKILEEMKRKSL